MSIFEIKLGRMKKAKRLKKVLLFGVLILITSGLSAQKIRKAVFVIADGIPADVVEKVATPNLDAIAREGGYTRAHVGGLLGEYSETPTISAVGYNSLLTGTWVNKHNVWDNDIPDPNYHYFTIFRFLKEQYPQKKTAIFSSWEDNRTKLVGDALPATGSFAVDYHFDGLELDTVNYPHADDRIFMHRIDEAVADKAAEGIRSVAPDLTWVYLEFTDDMGHKYGDSPQFYQAVEYMDNQVGRLWDAIRYREKNFNEEWEIYITTDHGRKPDNGKGHGGQSDRERTIWIVTNAKHLNEYFYKGNPGVVDIMPSIAEFLKIKIPKENLMEIDGVPLTGKISLSDPQAHLKDGRITVKWKPQDKKGKVKVWLTTTNNFKSGGQDHYILAGTARLKDGKYTLPVEDSASPFYKIVLEAPSNMVNTWYVEKK